MPIPSSTAARTTSELFVCRFPATRTDYVMPIGTAAPGPAVKRHSLRVASSV